MNLFKKLKNLIKDWRQFKAMREQAIFDMKRGPMPIVECEKKYRIQKICGSFIVRSDRFGLAVDKYRENQKRLFGEQIANFIEETKTQIDGNRTQYNFSLYIGVPK